MGNLGLGVIIHHLSGGAENSADKYYGRKIKGAEFGDDKLKITFDDGVQISIFDGGQSCCENRYMNTSDDVKWLVGKTLTGLTLKDAPDENGDYDVHEVQFLEVMTDHGCIIFANHNEHNGYYGGFGMNIKEISTRESDNV